MIPMGLWYWLIRRGVSRNEIDKKPMFLLDQYKWNSQTKDRLHWIVTKGKSQPTNQFPDLSQFADPE